MATLSAYSLRGTWLHHYIIQLAGNVATPFQHTASGARGYTVTAYSMRGTWLHCYSTQHAGHVATLLQHTACGARGYTVTAYSIWGTWLHCYSIQHAGRVATLLQHIAYGARGYTVTAHSIQHVATAYGERSYSTRGTLLWYTRQHLTGIQDTSSGSVIKANNDYLTSQ